MRYNTVISNTYGPPPQAHRYSELHPVNNHDHNVLENNEEDEIRELTSTGTLDTIPIMNVLSPDRTIGGGRNMKTTP